MLLKKLDSEVKFDKYRFLWWGGASGIFAPKTNCKLCTRKI